MKREIKPLPLPLAMLSLGSAIFTGIYIFIYLVNPISIDFSNFFLVYAIVAAALLAAIIALRVWFSFGVHDAPRSIWRYFSLAMLCWASGEITWGFYFLADPEVPPISVADAFWLVGLIFFGLAFRDQYRLLFKPSWSVEIRWIGLTVIVTLLLSAATTQLLLSILFNHELNWIETLVAVFYGYSDLAMMVAALVLARQFRKGLWGLAWIGLLAFTISDGLYSWLSLTGVYAYSVEVGNHLTMFVDTLYLAAYLLIALTCMVQLLLVRYGPGLRPFQFNPSEP
jgi:hypothetical protein